ncbi:hypothetical protein Tco_1485246 [Tanacetum coccineum]
MMNPDNVVPEMGLTLERKEASKHRKKARQYELLDRSSLQTFIFLKPLLRFALVKQHPAVPMTCRKGKPKLGRKESKARPGRRKQELVVGNFPMFFYGPIEQ